MKLRLVILSRTIPASELIRKRFGSFDSKVKVYDFPIHSFTPNGTIKMWVHILKSTVTLNHNIKQMNNLTRTTYWRNDIKYYEYTYKFINSFGDNYNKMINIFDAKINNILIKLAKNS
jgi:hypothetical protein